MYAEQPQYKVNSEHKDKDLICNDTDWLRAGTATKKTKWSVKQTKEIEIKKRKEDESTISKQQLFQL